VIRVYDEAGNVIETHEQAVDFQRLVSLPSLPLRLQIWLRSRCLRGRSPSHPPLARGCGLAVWLKCLSEWSEVHCL